MRSHITKHKIIYLSCSSLLKSITLGIYLSLFSTNITQGYEFFKVFELLKTWNFFLLATIGLVFFDIWITNVSKTVQSEEKTALVNKILEMSSRSLVYPHKNRHIRAIVTICNFKKKTRKTTFSYNITASPERTAEYDIHFGVTGEAIIGKTAIAKGLPENHFETYSEKEKKIVEPMLRCVLAAPIFSINNPDKVIGVLAFDSLNELKVAGFDTPASKEIAQSWADILSHMI
jgi:hypothetical protein